MKRSVEVLVVAAVLLLFGFAESVPAQTFRRAGVTPVAPPVRVAPQPAAPTINNTGVGRVYTPTSSIAAPGSAGVSAHTNVEVFVPNGFKPGLASPPFSGYGYNTPASIACIYGAVTFVLGNGYCNPNDNLANPSGGSQTIAIVDAYDDPWIAVDLAYFSAQFGLPFSPSQLQVVYASGTEPPGDPTGGWELEESLDVEWAHAMAPNANIVLVEAASNSYGDLLTAVHVASCEVVYGNPACTGSPTGSGEVSMSWGSSEWSGETSYDTYFSNTGLGLPNVVYFAASGDSPGTSYPCVSPNVVCVGATTYSRYPFGTPNNAGGAFSQHAFGGQVQGTWNLSGGGSSAYEGIPTYQSSIASTLQTLNNSTSTTVPILGYPVGVGISTTNRAVPDISANGNPYTGVWVFDSFDFALPGYCTPTTLNPQPCEPLNGWWIVGGTSASTPIIAGMANLAGNFRASSAAELTFMYSHMGSFNDVIFGTGQCGPYQGYTANTGWDPCTGVGTPLGLAGF